MWSEFCLTSDRFRCMFATKKGDVMSFSWPTWEQFIYRVARLRRVVVLAVFAAIVVAILYAANVAVPLENVMFILGLVAISVVFHVGLFPNVPLETMSIAPAMTAFLLALPRLATLASDAPVQYRDAAHVLIVVMAVIAAFAGTLVLNVLLSMLLYWGKAMNWRLNARAEFPMSVKAAHCAFGLRPDQLRGRVLTGSADANGFFDVAVMSHHLTDPENGDQPLIIKIDAKILTSDQSTHEVMLVLASGQVTVCSYHFTPTVTGCRVDVSEIPGDFTIGMHVLFWLTDQQFDNLIEMADIATRKCPRANGVSHAVSLFSLAGIVLSPRRPALD